MPELADLTSILLGALSAQQGWQDTVTVPQPAAGVQLLQHVVDGDYWERVVTLACKLTMSAVVANRFPQIRIGDGDGNTRYAIGPPAAVVAGATLTMYGAPGGANNQNNSGSAWFALPDIILPAGWNIAISNVGGDAGDQIGPIMLVVQRIPTDAVRQLAGQ